MNTTLDRLRALSEGLVGPELMVRLVESLPDALVVCDSSGKVVLANGQAELLLGYHRSELLGHPVEMLIPEGLREQHADHRANYLENPQVRPMGRNLELQALHKSGRTIPVQINLSPIQAPEGLFVSAVIRRKT